MFNLMKLEQKRNNLKTYIVASIIIGVVMLGFLYLFAYAPHIDPDPDLKIFAGYNNIIALFSTLSMAAFATLSSVLYTRFIIDEYKDKRVLLLFSYPINRERVLLAKILVVVMFTVAANITCNLIAFSIFGISESIYHLVDGSLSFTIMMRAAKMTVLSAAMASGIGLLAMGVGFIKKSVPSTIVSAVLLASLFCNIIFNSSSNTQKIDAASLIFAGISIIVGLISAALVAQKVKKMEVV